MTVVHRNPICIEFYMKECETPIIVSAKSRNIEMTIELLYRGVNWKHKNLYEKTFLDFLEGSDKAYAEEHIKKLHNIKHCKR